MQRQIHLSHGVLSRKNTSGSEVGGDGTTRLTGRNALRGGAVCTYKQNFCRFLAQRLKALACSETGPGVYNFTFQSLGVEVRVTRNDWPRVDVWCFGKERCTDANR